MKYEEIGSRLRQIRRESGIKLCEAEEITGYTTIHICAMERGMKMSIFSMCNMLELYGYEVEFVKKEENNGQMVR